MPVLTGVTLPQQELEECFDNRRPATKLLWATVLRPVTCVVSLLQGLSAPSELCVLLV